MDYKKIKVAFLVGLPISIALRFLQLWFTVETDTGFFKHNFRALGNYISFIIFLIAMTLAVFGFFGRRIPQNPPKATIPLGVVSVAYAISVLYEIFTDNITSTAIMPWQLTALKLTGIISAVFFVVFGLQSVANFRLPDICAIAPMLYLILRIICDFTAISSLAMISDNLMLMGAYCTSLWFMLQFAKLYNQTDTKYNTKKLVSSGLAAVTLCFSQSLPHILINIFSGYNYLHTTVSANFNLLILGIFILIFLISHFGKSAYKHSAN